MTKDDSIIFLTDKYGKRDRTPEIKNISYDNVKGIWCINFIGDQRTFHYKRENVQVIKNCLKDKQSATVFDYLLQMTQFSDIKNEEGQNLLVKNLEKSRFINEHSVLARYLNSKKVKLEKGNAKSLIFPFGCNNSQFKAVSTAINNQISIIQGPPGTGKTQTILNIIANLLINNKTVLIVSNNNDATANVYEKLASEKYGLGFICAAHGKRQNIQAFLKNQQQFYPEYLKDWKNQLPEFSSLLDEEINRLEEFFEANERISTINTELSSLENEVKYFESTVHDIYENKKILKNSSADLMDLLQIIQFFYAEKETLGFFKKFKLKTKYGIGPRKFWIMDPEKVIDTIKVTYYSLKRTELNNELLKKENIVTGFNASEVYDKCLKVLRLEIANKYLKNSARYQFKDRKEIYFNPRTFVNEYPVILSTTFSSRATIGQSFYSIM